jgi:hypothetical protein
LRQHAGAVRYETVGVVLIEVPNGLVRISGHTDATIWVDEERTRVLVYEGDARLEATGGGLGLVVARDQRAELGADHRLSGPFDRAEQLLRNGDFARREEGWVRHDHQDGPPDVDGQRLWVSGPQVGDRTLPALRVSRESATLAHGETGVRQALNLNVSGYRHLWLAAWVRVDRASLSGGGQLGSEYPMMLRVHYEGPVPGSEPNWVHGFYVANPENRPVRDAELVPQGEWVEYRVDLMETDTSRLPYMLRDLEVMGQGHSYDARVADVRLIGD